MILQHKHLIVRAEIKNPIKDPKELEKWIRDLIDIIEMKVMFGPVAVYCDVEGNRGATGIAIIETSSITFHSWDEVDPALLQLDVYTCGKLEIQKVFDHMKSMDPSKIQYKFLDREHDLIEIK